ncbi:protein translocase subunit SecF [Testudinibacter sp. TR-2022]|uniref:protein translocase subunit SecF n=1 Tax=Testudinibacter sp. TR-2022 TaxID=2585029 RepID=UPI00111A8869|nr:protein translocase subunit SecF [Testudinibacter sp. TR-2022]TNH06658.1 protein translocase subunit SecF [Pasteurellaceae bacterium Phil11]TNH25557.1 protein translocase subunit SecF [Testudinibacter sp. TR-2022]TNH25712.1 protein translocase subunit SecF [Testudinibacter sp. TR-2022]
MKYRPLGYIFSVAVVAISLFFVITKGFNWGLDFTGGTVIEATFSQPADLPKVRSVLAENEFTSAIVQASGGTRDVMIRLPSADGDTTIGPKIINILHGIDAQATVNSIEFVGPNVGKELTEAAIYATLATLIMLLLYVGLRFEWRLGTGAILALAHDVIVTLGVFAALQVEIDLTFVAAILSVIGYSLNDSIVVFDRIRENFRKIRRIPAVEIIDISLTQTLARTLMTSATTLVVVLALYIFGGPSIHNFSLALLVGIGFGTYSSIYIATSLAFDLGLRREHMLPPKIEKEGEDQNAIMP